MSRYPTFSAPEPSEYDELFVVNSIEAFHKALSFINSFNSLSRYQNCVTPQEGVQFVSQDNNACCLRHSSVEGANNVPQCLNQSYCGMQMNCLCRLSQEGVELCAHGFNQSETGMLIDCCKLDDASNNHCLRPESLTNSQFLPSILSNNLQLMSTFFSNNRINMTTPKNTKRTPTDSNTPISQPDSMTLLQPNTEQAELQTFVETFPVSSPNFRRPSPRPQLRSRQMNRMSRIDQIRQRNRTRERAAKTRFVATRTTTRKDSHSQLLEAMRRCRPSKPGRNNLAEKIGVLAVNGGTVSFLIQEGNSGLARAL